MTAGRIRRNFRMERPLAILGAMSCAINLTLMVPLTIHDLLYNEPKINDYTKVEAAAKYLSSYSDREPAKAVEDTYEVIHLARQANPGEEHIIALESELQQLESQLTGVDNPLIYESKLSAAAGDISSYLQAHDQTVRTSFIFGGGTLLAMLLGAYCIYSILPTAEERAERNNNANTTGKKQRYDNDLHNNDEFRNHDD
jgi:hypothetical protein